MPSRTGCCSTRTTRTTASSRPGMVDSEHPLFIAYTSGTTGRPEGIGPRPRRLRREDRRGGRLPVRRAGRATASSGSPTSAGSWAPGRSSAALANGATVCLYEGAPDWPEPDRLWAYLERHRVTVLGISPDAHPRAHGPRRPTRSSATTCRALRVLGLDRRAVERGPVALVLRRGRRRPLPGHQHLGRHRGGRLLPVAPPGAGPHADDPRRPGARHGRRRVRRRGQARAGAGRRAGVHQAVARHDPGAVAGARALPRDVLGPLARRVGARRLGVDRGRPAGTCTAAATTPSRWPASGSARPRWSRPWCRTRRCWRRRRSVCPTR